MKKLLSIILIVVLLLGAVPVFADNSFTENDVRYINATWINYEEEYSIWKVILTSYNDRNSINSELSSIIRRQITEGLDAAALEAEKLARYLSTDVVKYIAYALFDLTVTDNVVKLVESKPGMKLRLTVDVNLDSDSPKPMVLHYSESTVKEWQVVDESDVWIGKDASLTIQLSNFCPVLVLIPEEISAGTEPENAKPITPVQDTSTIDPEIEISNTEPMHIEPALIVLLAISVLWLIAAAFVLYKTENNKRTGFSMALEETKLKAEIALASFGRKVVDAAQPQAELTDVSAEKTLSESEPAEVYEIKITSKPAQEKVNDGDDPLHLDTDSWFK